MRAAHRPAVRRLLIVFLLAGGACHHDPAPATPVVDPNDKPPLPPASGTPIGFLIDDAGDLALSDGQISRLRDIDTSLAAELEKIDAATRSANRPADGDAAPPPMQGGGRHGRHGGGGGGGGGGHHKHQGSGAPAPSSQAAVGKLADDRNADVKIALDAAFAVLDPAQQTKAKKVLADHDVDLDVGSAAAPTPTNGGEADPPPEP